MLGMLLLRAMFAVIACACLGGLVSAQASSIVIEPHASMHAGDHASLIVRLDLPADAAEPVLLTTGSEGSALEVVRGRFVRFDAADPKAPSLRFEVPMVARAPGTAIFRAHVLFYRCAKTCVAVEQDAQALIEIAPK